MNKLKQILKREGRSQIWLANQFNVTAVTVNYWCQNTHQPTLKRLNKIATILNVELKELLR